MFRLTQHMAALRLAMAPDDRSYEKSRGVVLRLPADFDPDRVSPPIAGGN